MNERILSRFLTSGLLDVNGDDERYRKVAATADSLAEHLKAHPDDILPFIYTALDPESPDDDPAVKTTLELLGSHWLTYANAYSTGVPTQLVRSIILDAIVSIADENNEIEIAVALIVSSVVPFIDLGAEASIWSDVLRDIQYRVDERAETAWSVPSAIDTPAIDFGKPKPLKLAVKNGAIDRDALQEALQAAVGPNNLENQAIEGANPHESNSAPHWANEFAPRAAQAITDAVDPALKTAIPPINTTELLSGIEMVLSHNIGSMLERISSATLGLELRSRLLWWKEAAYSPSARVDYSSLSSTVAAALMAYDYQAPLPCLTPGSVVAFFKSVLRQLNQADGSKRSVADLVTEVSGSDSVGSLLQEIEGMSFGSGRQPMISTLKKGGDATSLLNANAPFGAETKMDLVDFAVIILLEIQGMKALALIDPVSLDDDDTVQAE